MLAGIMEDKRSNSVVRKRKKAMYIAGGTYVVVCDFVLYHLKD
jgi:hypothetical protein